ncbi:MAG: hypothetical protein IJT94_10790 [Oscillibacter sp.]|nr:hypothetical protein [Oscillibacter sp.]
MAQKIDDEKKQQMQGHRQRLRLRYREDGLNAFREDYEVLELLLQYAVPRRDTKVLAKSSSITSAVSMKCLTLR